MKNLKTKEECNKMYVELRTISTSVEVYGLSLLREYFSKRYLLLKVARIVLLISIIFTIISLFYSANLLTVFSGISFGISLFVLVFILISWDVDLYSDSKFVKRRELISKVKNPDFIKKYNEWIEMLDKYEKLNNESKSSQYYLAYENIIKNVENETLKEFMINKIFNE